MLDYLRTAGLIFIFVLCYVVAWKTHDYFETSAIDEFTKSRFEYHAKKIGLSFTKSLVLFGIIWYVFFKSGKNSTDQITPSTQIESKTSTQQQTPTTQLESTQSTSNNSVNNSTSNLPETTKQYSKEEIEAMEEKAQYHGDDPTIRARLGLPPKLSQ